MSPEQIQLAKEFSVKPESVTKAANLRAWIAFIEAIGLSEDRTNCVIAAYLENNP